ncbi:MAG: Asp-tRNA(Asn)/Glu-tRNA(Gln) amidotransferase GatCAB subunit C [Candidatus Taylorbacteria bacterium CG10_big_fil_rev_8_21_14_0_10_41_48]|uniref:Asp-tRNA(Asn)/Glu-tRNA(Gln) amidotransferase GatCAB subunit C n=1 Tax=Candidatus Taylorbacteria bacterium CG10_big_fil_rev_8_21_14_0_10_41_48 TaxID=1975024 RepID=A0A2M8LC48_9BACT|nr:MAG: Asp-tRNA(Asn)/Glu-tRNA(Gln) amidotransferase GatCAB subunit C [Candidatus Taylorbacteria bacterium CG10_big_fil_rev_8_21_14_0_10_41_48]
MITIQDIEKLATLSRLSLNDNEKEKYRGEIDFILGYIDIIKKVSTGESVSVMSRNKNILREDIDPHESGLYTEKLLKLAPKNEAGYVKVKKIL